MFQDYRLKARTKIKTRHQRLLINYSNSNSLLTNGNHELVNAFGRILYTCIIIMKPAVWDLRFRSISQKIFCKLLRGFMK
jgi:hypothetical protein